MHTQHASNASTLSALAAHCLCLLAKFCTKAPSTTRRAMQLLKSIPQVQARCMVCYTTDAGCQHNLFDPPALVM